MTSDPLTTALVEVMARAMWDDPSFPPPKSWEECPESLRDDFRNEARAALSALRAKEAEVGLVMVPREPTEEMVEAALAAGLDIYWNYRADGRPGGPEDVYRAMLPKPPGAP